MMTSKDIGPEDITAIWQAVNDLHPRLDHLPNAQRGQVISALLGLWVSQHHDEKHRDELMQWVVDAARSMATMVDAGLINPQVLGTKGNA